MGISALEEPSVFSSADSSAIADIVIIGSGISGTLAATALGRAGYKIVLIDRHAVYPADFRAEHLDGPMVEQLQRLGFLTDLTTGLFRGETVSVARFGRIVTNSPTVNFGLRYEVLVNRARAILPSNVRQIIGRVAAIATSDTVQQVRLSNGAAISGRLLIIATGQGFALAKQVGIDRRILREAHSLTFGFDIESEKGSGFQHSFLVYQREYIRDKIDYLAAFTMGSAMRVNLFTYRDYKAPWTKAFLSDPDPGLHQLFPQLSDVLGPYRALKPAVARPIDLYVAENYRKDGVVLIGDAFQASCPATGMGMVRLLTDIEQLTTIYAPQWLASPGMDANKLSAFYDDPVKCACDAKALHDAEYRRAVSTELGLGWNIHRSRVQATERLKAWWSGPRNVSDMTETRTGHTDASLAPG